MVVLYEDSEDNVYLYEDGDTKRILKSVFWVMAAFGRADEFLYRTEDGQMYCYLQGDKTCLSEDGSLPRLVTDSTYDWRLVDKQFLIEDDGILYYVNLPNDREEVGETDGYYVASPDSRYVLNLRDGDLYLMRRTGSAWQDVGKLCEYPLQAMFDPSGNSVYYISGAGEDAFSGELCLAAVNSGVGESLLDDVTRVVLADGQIYAMTKKGDVYLMPRSGEPELIAEGVLAIYSGAEGVYVKSASGLYYCSGGESSEVSGSTSVLGINGYFLPAG